MGKIEFLRLSIKPGEKNTRKEQVTHEGEECGLLLQGKVLVKLGNQEYILEEGDSIRIDSTIPHSFINIGDTTSVFIWAITSPKF